MRSSKATVIRIAGAYVAWVMGSGFATGQEILQFFTSYGYTSVILIAMNLAGFLLIGPMILQAGFENGDESHFRYFCGKGLGTFYDWFLPVSMFAGMVILISGAGATLHEYYGLNHYVGALIMAAAALAAYVAGFQRFVRVVSFIGPAIIAFIVVIGAVTLFRDWGGLAFVNDYPEEMAAKQPVTFPWLSGLLYISYNLCGGSKYYSALGRSANTAREAVWGAVIGTIALMAAILLMNCAMLTDIGHTAVQDVPTLFLTRKISYSLGAVFSIILIMGIFASCSAMLWTVSEKFVRQGSAKSRLFAACVTLAAFLLGLLPFAALVGKIYTVLGYAGLLFAGCVTYRRIRRITGEKEK
ncbi:MAG: YkvI family membrane protein [Bacillota bacterium]